MNVAATRSPRRRERPSILATHRAPRTGILRAVLLGTLRADAGGEEKSLMNSRIIRFITAAALLGNFALLGLSACAHEGPAQKAGRHIDNAADDVKSDLKK
jgi:hypothetical protein